MNLLRFGGVLVVAALFFVNLGAVDPGVSGSVTTVTAASAPEYRLHPGDLVRVEVFDNPDLASQFRVPSTGGTSFPLVGDIGVLANRSLVELTRDLRTRLESRYLKQAIVIITILEFGPRFAYVMGSVHQPDAIPLNPHRVVTAMQAIAQSGGFLEDADRAGAQVLRDDPAVIGGKIAMAVPSGDQAVDMAKDVPLEPGDVIIVPKLHRVYVIGKVEKPGALVLPNTEQLTVSKAISLAGGFARFARQDVVQLVRSGAVSTVDVQSILTGQTKIDPPLRPGDTVYVQEARF
jgi:polysaccharide export outer membrane protein